MRTICNIDSFVPTHLLSEPPVASCAGLWRGDPREGRLESSTRYCNRYLKRYGLRRTGRPVSGRSARGREDGSLGASGPGFRVAVGSSGCAKASTRPDASAGPVRWSGWQARRYLWPVSGLLHPHVRQIVGETAIQAVTDVFDTGPTASTYPQAFVELAQRAGPLADRVVDIAFTHPVTDTDDHKLASDDPVDPQIEYIARMRTIRNSSVSVNLDAKQVPDDRYDVALAAGSRAPRDHRDQEGRVSTAGKGLQLGLQVVG